MGNDLHFSLSMGAIDEIRRVMLHHPPDWLPGLVKESHSKEDQGKWYVAGYAPDQIQHIEAEYSARKLPLRHEVSGVSLVILQPWFLAELNGKLLEHGSQGFTLISRNET